MSVHWTPKKIIPKSNKKTWLPLWNPISAIWYNIPHFAPILVAGFPPSLSYILIPRMQKLGQSLAPQGFDLVLESIAGSPIT